MEPIYQKIKELEEKIQTQDREIKELQSSEVWNGMSPDTRQNIGDCVIGGVNEGTSIAQFIYKNKVYNFPIEDSSGNTVFPGNVTVTGNETVGGTLGVTGASTFTGAITANGSATFNSTLVVHAGLNINANVAFGYVSGSGATVTQATSRTTGVTLNGYTGTIVTNNTSLAAGSAATFTVSNSLMFSPYVVCICCQGGQTAGTSIPFVTNVTTGSFDITLRNFHASTADTGAMTIAFSVFRASTN